MAYLSPQVEVNETDNTQTTVQVGTSMGMTVITAGWGPVNDPQLLTGENDLVAIFGKPNSKTLSHGSQPQTSWTILHKCMLFAQVQRRNEMQV